MKKPADPAHEAVEVVARQASPRGFVTTDYVFVESYLLIEARLGVDAACRFWSGIRGGGALLIGVLGVDLARAWW